MALDTLPTVSSTATAEVPVRLRVIDTDVHHGIRAPADLFPYLSQVYRERVADYGFGGGGGLYAYNGGKKGYRVDSLDDESPPGVSVVAVNVDKTRRHL